jgi:ribonuclease HII
MPWIIGIDEAGYGPNLGPLVMSSVACRVPDKLTDGNLWRALRKVIRRSPSENDGRLLVDDSKLVYSPARGLLDLEISVLTICFALEGVDNLTLSDLLNGVCPGHCASLAGQTWFTGKSKVPIQAERVLVQEKARHFQQLCARRDVSLGVVRSVVICPGRFNQMLEQWGSKGAALSEALSELLQFNLRHRANGEPVHFCIDKHGGRNFYAAQLQHALQDGFVIAEMETAERSAYRVLGLGGEVRLAIQPRADAGHFCVALASMVSKYIRECLMAEFNAFWQGHIPGLKRTAGYPGDAARFLEAIRPVMQKLRIPESTLWRAR